MTPGSPPPPSVLFTVAWNLKSSRLWCHSSCPHNRTSVWIFPALFPVCSIEQMCNCQTGTDFPDTVLSLSISSCIVTVQIHILPSSYVFRLICHGLFHGKEIWPICEMYTVWPWFIELHSKGCWFSHVLWSEWMNGWCVCALQINCGQLI